MQQEISMPNANDFLPGAFLNAVSIPVGVRISAKITKVEPHKFDDGFKLVVYTDGTKGVPLNKTRGQVLINAFGQDYANWIGATIVIYRGETRFGGQRVASVEIEAPITSAPPHGRVPDGPDGDETVPL
jgi:hypothetical protein